MLSTAITTIVGDLRPVRKPARVLYRGGAFWLLVAALHIIPLARDGWDWAGPLSFRKPIVFSVSMGLLLVTMGWVLDRLPERRRLAGGLAWTFLVSSSIEVALITTQTWRGRASHFNVFENGDAMIFAGMGVAVLVMSLCLLVLFIWSIIERPADPLVRIAVIGGLALVMTGLGIGQIMIEIGNDFAAAHQRVPDVVTYGAGGEPKFPHAVAFHGIQLFILAAVMLRRGGLSEPGRRRSMRTIVWSYTAALGFASTQVILGYGPAQPTIWSVGVATAIVVIGLTFLRILRAVKTGASENLADPSKVR